MKTLELVLAFINHLRIEKKYSVHTCDSYKNDLLQFNSFVEIKAPLLQCMLFFILGMIQVSTSKSPK
ncbi:MAG: site-specific integrase [Saprospiraceae bacterium]|nr:site-specific integrase [Saprospiraceae bacterium]